MKFLKVWQLAVFFSFLHNTAMNQDKQTVSTNVSLPAISQLGLTGPASLLFQSSYNLIAQQYDWKKAEIPKDLKKSINRLKKQLFQIAGSDYAPITKKLLYNLLNNREYEIDIKRFIQDPAIDKQDLLNFALYQVVQKPGGEMLIDPLIKAGADVNAQYTQFNMPLLTVAIADSQEPSIAKIQKLLAHNPALNAASITGETALIPASLTKHLEILKLLLAHNADPNVQTISGLTPLIQAVIDRNLEGIKLLLKAGADQHTEFNGLTPLERAKRAKRYDIISLLTKKKYNS